MKAIKFISLICLTLTLVFTATKTYAQNTENTKIIVGVFDGFDEEDGYMFTINTTEDDSEEVMYFTDIDETVLENYNLKSTNFEGKKFEITYKINVFEDEDEEGYTETYETLTIISLKQL